MSPLPHIKKITEIKTSLSTSAFAFAIANAVPPLCSLYPFSHHPLNPPSPTPIPFSRTAPITSFSCPLSPLSLSLSLSLLQKQSTLICLFSYLLPWGDHLQLPISCSEKMGTPDLAPDPRPLRQLLRRAHPGLPLQPDAAEPARPVPQLALRPDPRLGLFPLQPRGALLGRQRARGLDPL